MKTVENSNKKLILFVIVSMLTWGISWPSNKVLSNYGSAIDLGVYRYLLVILSMVFFFVFSKTSLKISKNGIVSVVVSGALMAVYNFTFLSGLQYGNPGAGGILVTTLNTVFAYGIGALLAWEKPRI
ncbi:MAG TPA: DMT family transporter, partial [Fluviicola sp.]|nr:DMT family transporter [Fluviicola sp.]